jgi:23S rRNA (cytidine2498-2'-O)-methyltransferase
VEKNKRNKIVQVFVAHRGFEKELATEISENGLMHNRLGFAYSGLSKVPVWQEQGWNSPEIFEFDSIKQASDYLISKEKNDLEKQQRNEKSASGLQIKDSTPIFWVNASQEFHRRSALISENLRMARFKDIHFLQEIPPKKIACFALLDPKRLICSTEISNSFALGEFSFVENKEIPPSRAYTKLWELFTITDVSQKYYQFIS